jgi:hypothetical protein
MAWYQQRERRGRHFPASGPSRHKGSRKRVGRIRLGEHWSPEIVIFWLGVILILLVAVPWWIAHPIK